MSTDRAFRCPRTRCAVIGLVALIGSAGCEEAGTTAPPPPAARQTTEAPAVAPRRSGTSIENQPASTLGKAKRRAQDVAGDLEQRQKDLVDQIEKDLEDG